MFNSMVAQIQNFNLQIKNQSVPVFGVSLSKVTSQNIFVSSDLAPNLNLFHGIAGVFSKPSNIYHHTSRLRTHTRFTTPLSDDLKPDITNPTSRKIVLSSDMAPDLSAGHNYVQLIARVFREPFLLNSSCHKFENPTKDEKNIIQLWLRMAVYLNYISSRYVFRYYFVSLKNYAGRKMKNMMWLSMVAEFMSVYFHGYNYLDNVSFLECQEQASVLFPPPPCPFQLSVYGENKAMVPSATYSVHTLCHSKTPSATSKKSSRS